MGDWAIGGSCPAPPGDRTSAGRALPMHQRRLCDTPWVTSAAHAGVMKRPKKRDVAKEEEIRGQSRELQGQEPPPFLLSVRARVELLET